MQMLPAVTTAGQYPCYTFNLPNLWTSKTKKILGGEITSVSKSPLPKKNTHKEMPSENSNLVYGLECLVDYTYNC